jgi:hypothetical protein
MSLRKQFKMSSKALDEGAPFYLAPNEDGTVPCIWVRHISAGDTEYNKVADRIMEPHRRAQELGALPQDKLNGLLRQVFAEGCIAKWENVLLSDVNDNDTDAGFADPTHENKLALLVALPELHNELRTFAVQRANYLEANMKDDAKN